eukprot:12488-Heterococcus_DN1.PRE.3
MSAGRAITEAIAYNEHCDHKQHSNNRPVKCSTASRKVLLGTVPVCTQTPPTMELLSTTATLCGDYGEIGPAAGSVSAHVLFAQVTATFALSHGYCDSILHLFTRHIASREESCFTDMSQVPPWHVCNAILECAVYNMQSRGVQWTNFNLHLGYHDTTDIRPTLPNLALSLAHATAEGPEPMIIKS